MPFEQVVHHYIGLDLGQRRDHTAIAIVSSVNIVLDGRDPVTHATRSRDELRLVHIHRFTLGTSYTTYPKVIRRIANILGASAPITLVVDGSGPGLPVVNMLREAGLPVGSGANWQAAQIRTLPLHRSGSPFAHAASAARQMSGIVAWRPPNFSVLNCPFLIFSANSMPPITMSAV